MLGLILGLGYDDKLLKTKSLPIFNEAASWAEGGGFVRLRAALLNASGLVKYQTAGNSVELLESGLEDLNDAFRLNTYIGDARSCFQQKRNIGLIHVKLSRLQNKPELLEKAIQDFRDGEKFLYRLSMSRILGELLEIRFRLGETLVSAGKTEEAQPILSQVREERGNLNDWHNEARTLELLMKCAKDKPVELLKIANQLKDIYEDAKTNDTKLMRFKKQPITATNGSQILKTAADLILDVDAQLSLLIKDLAQALFFKISTN